MGWAQEPDSRVDVDYLEPFLQYSYSGFILSLCVCVCVCARVRVHLCVWYVCFNGTLVLKCNF